MKIQGFMELIILMAFLVACIPLLTVLSMSCNESKITFMDDKTLVETYTTAQAESLVTPIKLGKEDVYLAMLIFDRVAPSSNATVQVMNNSGSYTSINLITETAYTYKWSLNNSKSPFYTAYAGYSRYVDGAILYGDKSRIILVPVNISSDSAVATKVSNKYYSYY